MQKRIILCIIMLCLIFVTVPNGTLVLRPGEGERNCL